MRTPDDIGTPVYVPQGPSDVGRLLDSCVASCRPALLSVASDFQAHPTAQAFFEFEEKGLRLFMNAAAQFSAGVLACVLRDPAWVNAAVAAARERSGNPLRNQGLRTTPVRFLGGVQVALTTPYLSRDLREKPGPRRGHGRRGPTGTGCYPALMALGIWDRATPAFASEVARQAVRAGSFEEATEALAERGVDLDEKSVMALTRHVATEALRQREARIRAAGLGAVLTEEFVGQRIVIGVDGGRLRTRKGGQHGRRGKKGHRGYTGEWREPKMLSVYVIDPSGRRDPHRTVLYEGTMGDADDLFRILVAELELRGAARAEEIILSADGAPWIWNRAGDIAVALGLPDDRIVRVADFYHAVEHLTKLSELCAGWTEAKRKQWVRRMRRLLKAGRVEEVIAAARKLRRGRNGARIGTEIAYFEDRREMMRYDRLKDRGIPIGSGAVESAIRRVVNLRMKGPSIFWRVENAAGMLHLRCYLKAGRWEELMRRVLTRSPCGTAASHCLREAA